MEKFSLEYGEYYHIYNRGNNGEILFKEVDNYSYFITLYEKYIPSIADTLTYCLMSNHFHLVIKVKNERDIKSFSELQLFDKNEKRIITDRKPTPSNQFAHLFSTYTKTINDKCQRTGSLFEHPFKRRMIDNELYLQHVIAYTHNNPVKAGIVEKMSDYKWSSYNALVSDKPTRIDRDLVMAILGNKEYFILYHGDIPSQPEFDNLFPEE